MLDHATAQNNLSRFLGTECTVVQKLDVLDEVDNKTLLSPGLEVDNVAECAISKGGTVNRDVILCTPVVNAFFIVYLLTDAFDDL